ncbi:MAG: hypothetical protein PHN39_02900 [Candidatus Pacebacteria bacterium]|nr:hypothetical protein [Candidatus Paceibacterota bacterium]
MQELVQILQYEQKKQEEIESARSEAQKIVQKRKEELRRQLELGAVLSQGEQAEIEQKAQAQIKIAAQTLQQETAQRLQQLEKSRQANLERAVKSVTEAFLNI